MWSVVGAWWLPLAAAPFVGSFLGVLVRRLPRGEGWAWGRSRCESCGHVLRAWELVPLVSFAAQRGRCTACGARIAWMHPGIEVAALAVAATAVVAGDSPIVWAGCLLGWWLLALAWIDAEHFWLPDVLTLPLVVAGLTITALIDPPGIADHALAALAGYGALRGVAWLYRRARGREGLGQGDAKLLGAAGAWLGLAALPWVVALAGLVGLLFVLARAAMRRQLPRATDAIPFGPPLAAGTWCVWMLLIIMNLTRTG